MSGASTSGPSNGSLLSVRGLCKEFVSRHRRAEGVVAVDDVSFEIERGTTLGLVGESGSGKTTTGYCVLRLLHIDRGEVLFEGNDLAQVRGRALRAMRREMQVVFQDPHSSLNPRMTVAQLLREPLEIHRIGTATSRKFAVAELLELVGLDAGVAGRFPHEFSGGQRQRIGIARALSLGPKFIVCDEPVSSLDVSVQAQILNLLQDIQQERGLTYLFISHDLAVIRAVCDRVAVMKEGRIVEQGSVTEVYEHPQHAYTRELIKASIPATIRQTEPSIPDSGG